MKTTEAAKNLKTTTANYQLTATTCFFYRFHLLLHLPLPLATPSIASPLLILTNCGKYNICLSCEFYIYCVCTRVIQSVRQLLLSFFIYCIDFPYFQDSSG